MKHRLQEQLRRAARQRHRDGPPLQLEAGLLQLYCYERPADSHSWWTDVAFVVNDYRVMLHWIHPRLAYEDCLLTEEAKAAEAAYDIIPFMRSHWTRRCRVVTLCVPLEVRNVDELRALVQLARRLLKRQATLAAEFPAYHYTRTDWLAEGHGKPVQP